jgi:putative peptidoglycan lipid II flippase
MLSRHIQAGNAAEAQRVQSHAVEIAMLLCLPSAAALAVCAEAFTTAIFQGGKMTAGDTALMGKIVVALVAGLPAYVLVKVFQPAFFSREDTRTPVMVAAGALAANIALNFYVVPRFGIVGLAAATAITATLNVAALVAILHWRGWFQLTAALAGKIARQGVASAAMAAALWFLTPALEPFWHAAAWYHRIWSLAALVTVGAALFFGCAFLLGALDKELLAQVRRRRPKSHGAAA